MKLFLLVTLLGTALASPGGFSYGYSTAYGPLARHALAYGGFAAAPAGYAHYSSAVAAAPVAYHTGAVHGYAAAAPAVATYAAAAPAVATYSAPAAAVVPVTRVSAQPAVVQNVVDVAQPKLATRRYEIRRPAIQKQFYDVEERVVVRPAGSAVVELDTPIGANQRGPTQVRPAAPPVALQAYTSTHLGHHVLHAAPIAVPTIPHHPAVVEQSQEIPQQVEQVSQIQQQPIPQQPISQQPSQQQQQFDDSDSVSVDNPEFSVRTQAPQNLPSPLFRSQLSEFSRSEASQFNQYSRGPQPQPQQLSSEGLPSFSRSRVTEYLQPEALPPQQVRSQPAPARQQEAISFARSQLPSVSPTPEVSPRLGPTPQPLQEPELESRSFGAEVIPSVRNLSPEQSQANQARLIELLTARGPVSEVRSASEPIRGRVLSATPAPPGAEPADERVNTRRIVVNRPIQTVQEVDVVEPFTKLERVAVHQPAVVKTAHLEYAAVPAVHTAVHAVHTPVHAVHTAVPAAVTVAPHYYKK